jgi:hypothetical protein
MKPLAPSSIIRRSPQTANRMFEGQMLVITTDDSMLHRLNEVGTFIWEFLEKPHSIDEICKAIELHFKGFDSSLGSQDIIRFVGEMKTKGLVTTPDADE